MFLIIQEGSAVLFIIIRTLKTPITSYLASYPQLAGVSASPVTVADWYAFVMLITASIVYYYNKETNVHIRRMKRLEDDNTPIIRPIRPTINQRYKSSNFTSIVLFPEESENSEESLIL
jgi:hypothetical protein